MSKFATTFGGGASVTVIGQGLKLLFQLTSVLILSRFLSPADFGLVAMVLVFVALADLIRDFGLSTIAIQRQELNNQQASNLFWINTALGFVTAGLLALFTPVIVVIYGDQRLWAIVPALAPVLALAGISTQFRVQAVRGLKFTAINIAEVLVQLASLAVAVTAAFYGLGYWSIVSSSLFAASFTLISLITISKWLPQKPRNIAESRELLRDGSNFGLAHFLTYLSTYADTLAIGIQWGPTSVGFYDRGFQFYSIPGSKILSPLTQVVIPYVNRAITQGKTIDSVLLRIQFLIGAPIIWLFAMAGVTAPVIIPIVLGPGWGPTVPIFQILALGGMLSPLSNVNYWRIILQNLGSELVKYNLVTKLMTVAFIVFASFTSTEAVAWAVTIGLALTWPIALMWFSRAVAWPANLYFKEGIMVLLPGLFAYLGGYFTLSALKNQDDLFSISLAATTVTLIFILGLLLMPGGRKQIYSCRFSSSP
jgi:PST family polysaccharide transporter